MSFLRIHHVGYLVVSIEESILQFKKLGYIIKQETIVDNIRNSYICFLEKDGYVIELVSPINEKSVVYKLLKKYKNSPYHICYETEEFDLQVNKLQEEGYMVIQEPCIAPAIANKRVIFLVNNNIGIIELVETKYSDDVAIQN